MVTIFKIQKNGALSALVHAQPGGTEPEVFRWSQDGIKEEPVEVDEASLEARRSVRVPGSSEKSSSRLAYSCIARGCIYIN